MPVQSNPYLNFKDTARQAMEFYKGVFGGELTLATFAEYGMDGPAGNNVMHSQLEASDIVLMASDTPDHMEYAPAAGFSVSLSGDDEKTLRAYWDGLAKGATINQPLEKAPWGDTFGNLVDQFGISWVVNIAGTPA